MSKVIKKQFNWKSNADLLNDKKEERKNLLGTDCQEVILGGFDFTINHELFHFSYDQEAQLNFQDTMRLFDNNMVESVKWTVTQNGEKKRIELTKEQFNQVYMQSVKHKLDTIAHYRDELVPLLEQVQTEEQLEAITWETAMNYPITEPTELVDDKTLDKRIEQSNMAQAEMSSEMISLIMMMGMM